MSPQPQRNWSHHPVQLRVRHGPPRCPPPNGNEDNSKWRSRKGLRGDKPLVLWTKTSGHKAKVLGKSFRGHQTRTPSWAQGLGASEEAASGEGTGRRESPGWAEEDQPLPSREPLVGEGVGHAAVREPQGKGLSACTPQRLRQPAPSAPNRGIPGVTRPLPQLSQGTEPVGF